MKGTTSGKVIARFSEKNLLFELRPKEGLGYAKSWLRNSSSKGNSRWQIPKVGEKGQCGWGTGKEGKGREEGGRMRLEKPGTSWRAPVDLDTDLELVILCKDLG